MIGQYPQGRQLVCPDRSRVPQSHDLGKVLTDNSQYGQNSDVDDAAAIYPTNREQLRWEEK